MSYGNSDLGLYSGGRRICLEGPGETGVGHHLEHLEVDHLKDMFILFDCTSKKVHFDGIESVSR